MSDSGTTGEPTGDFRGSREEKRQDETVMIGADSLSDMVADAKAPAPAPASEDALAEETDLADSQLGRWLVVFGIVALLLAVIIFVWVYWIAA